MNEPRGPALVPLLTAVLITVSDQVTKQIVRYTFRIGESRPVIDGFFDLTYVQNTGAAWGVFRDHGGILIGVSVVMLVLMLIFRRSFLSPAWEHQLAFGLLIGGIIGNLMDRVRVSAVTDFLLFYIKSYQWPAFNVADSAICVGVFIYMASVFWIKGHPLHEPGDDAGDPIQSESTV